jgi:hypothetical protein
MACCVKTSYIVSVDRSNNTRCELHYTKWKGFQQQCMTAFFQTRQAKIIYGVATYNSKNDFLFTSFLSVPYRQAGCVRHNFTLSALFTVNTQTLSYWFANSYSTFAVYTDNNHTHRLTPKIRHASPSNEKMLISLDRHFPLTQFVYLFSKICYHTAFQDLVTRVAISTQLNKDPTRVSSSSSSSSSSSPSSSSASCSWMSGSVYSINAHPRIVLLFPGRPVTFCNWV